MRNIILIFIFAFFSFIAVGFINLIPTETVTCTIDTLVAQQKLTGTDGNITTDIRYLIVTDKGTFTSENNIIHGKFNNSDLFFHLKKGQTIEAKVTGFGKSFLTDYKNIIEYKVVK